MTVHEKQGDVKSDPSLRREKIEVKKSRKNKKAAVNDIQARPTKISKLFFMQNSFNLFYKLIFVRQIVNIP
jgi:hypothetical protein